MDKQIENESLSEDLLDGPDSVDPALWECLEYLYEYDPKEAAQRISSRVAMLDRAERWSVLVVVLDEAEPEYFWPIFGSVTYIEQSRLTNLCPEAIAHFLTICQTISRSTGVPRASLRLEFHGQRTDQQPSGLRADLKKIIHLCLVAQFSRDMLGLCLRTEVKARSYVIQLQFGCGSKHHPRPP